MANHVAMRILALVARAVLVGTVMGVLLLSAGDVGLADEGSGVGLQSANVVCGGFLVTVDSPPGRAITPVAFIDGHVWLTQTETISGPRGTFTQTYPIPTDGRPTVSCTITLSRIGVTITWTAVEVN